MEIQAVKDSKKIRGKRGSQPRSRVYCSRIGHCSWARATRFVGAGSEAAGVGGGGGRRRGAARWPAGPAAGEGAATEARARGVERTGGGARRGGGRCGGGDGAGRRRSGRRRRPRGGRGAGARARGGPSWASRAGTAAAMRSRGDTWRRRVGWRRWADAVRPGADTSVGADLAGMFFF